MTSSPLNLKTNVKQVAGYMLHRASGFIYQLLNKWHVTGFIEPLLLFINCKSSGMLYAS